MTTEDDDILEPYFRAGRTGPGASDDLMARVMAQAEALAAPSAAAPAARPAAARRGLLAGLMAALGGWPAMAGMATAAAAGVWVGFSSPDLVDGYLGTSQGIALGDYMPDVVEIAGGF